MAISSIGSVGGVNNRTVGSVGGDSTTPIQELLSMLQSGSTANSGGGAGGGGGCSCGCQGGGCSCCANKASKQAQSITG